MSDDVDDSYFDKADFVKLIGRGKVVRSQGKTVLRKKFLLDYVSLQ